MTPPPSCGPTARRSRTKLSVLAASCVVVLTGCAGLHPGSALVVGSQTVTHGSVDDLAAALCSANVAQAQGQVAPALPTRGARESAVQILLDTALSQQFGAEAGVEPNQQQVSQALTQNEQGVALLPEDQQEGFRVVLKEYAEGQLMLIEAGRQSLEDNDVTEISDDQALAEGQRLRTEFVAGLDVEVDPRYGSFVRGTIQPGTSSLSVPASDEAMAGTRAEPGPAFVSALPASQKCS